MPVPTTGIYLGIWADPDLPMMVQPPVTKNQESAVEIREGPAPWGINHPFALHLVYYNWTDIQTEVVNGAFPDSSLQGDIEHGRIPVISWHCDQSTTSGNTDALIASGDATETATITATAQALAKYPGPVLLRWFWEFSLLQSSEAGLNQYCLGDVGFTGTTLPPQVYADFIAAWQRIWQLFQQAGATNVSFLWNPGSYNSDTDPSYPGPYYPGSAFVDWIGVDTYQDVETHTFQNDFHLFYNDFSKPQYGGKPLMVGENGSANFSQYNMELQPAYLTDPATGLLADIQNNLYPQLKAYDYFDSAGNSGSWVLDASGGLAAMAILAASPSLSAGTYPLTAAVSPAGAGSITASPSSGGYYNAGISVQLTAVPHEGYEFVGWSGDLSGVANPQSIAMNASHSVTANFSPGVSSCSLSLNPASVSLPATGTSTAETCPNNSSQPNCGVTPEIPQSFNVTSGAGCGAWTASSSNPGSLQITSGAAGTGAGTVAFTLLTNTHKTQQTDSITVATGGASATYTVVQAGSGDSPTYREIYALYEQLLGRDPDPSGFAFWTGIGGAGLGQMGDAFLTGPEAFNSDFVVMAVYQAATGAPPTYAQFTAAVAGIRSGAQTAIGLFNSLIDTGYTTTTLYQNLLGRQPDAAEILEADNAGLDSWFETLIGYPSDSTPAGTPDNEFQSTGTYDTTLAADHTNGLYVQMLYYLILGRDPDPSGFSFWLGVANSGGPGILFQGASTYGTRIQILGPGTPNQGFIGSPEFQNLFAN